MTAPTPTRPLRILIADDNRDAADSLRELLLLAGHAVEVCYDGDDAAPLAEAFHPDVCILDLWMPVTGWEAARRLREWAGERPLLLLALTGLPKVEPISERAGFDAHYLKSSDPKDLVAALADYASRSHAY
ncbi:response regulator [bacterium]|nr:response regulator [bacterium]